MMMTAIEFFAEWSTKYSNLELTARDVAGSFPISVQAATKMLQAFVKEGKAKSTYYTASRVTVYSLAK